MFHAWVPHSRKRQHISELFFGPLTTQKLCPYIQQTDKETVIETDTGQRNIIKRLNFSFFFNIQHTLWLIYIEEKNFTPSLVTTIPIEGRSMEHLLTVSYVTTIRGRMRQAGGSRSFTWNSAVCKVFNKIAKQKNVLKEQKCVPCKVLCGDTLASSSYYFEKELLSCNWCSIRSWAYAICDEGDQVSLNTHSPHAWKRAHVMM